MRRFALAALVLAGCSSKQGATEQKDPPTPATHEETETMSIDATPAAAPTGWKARLGEVDKLVFHFQDSSVPPQYHRSYTIAVTSSAINKVVDSYGDIISENGNAISAEQFEGLKSQLDALGIDKGMPKDSREPGCSGGTSKSLALFVGADKIFDATRYSCGGDADGALKGDLEGLGKAIHALLIPSADGPTLAPK